MDTKRAQTRAQTTISNSILSIQFCIEAHPTLLNILPVNVITDFMLYDI